MTALLTTRSVEYLDRNGSNRPVSIAFPDITLEEGEVVAVVGPSYSGKSILMSLCAGLLRPTAGTVQRDTTVDGWGSSTFVPQALLLLPELTVTENIALGAGRLFLTKNDDTRAAIERAAAAVDVARLLDRRVDELSVGERQRVMVARAVVSRPKIVIADEPAAHQDAAHAASVLAALLAIRDDGGACMIFTRGDGVVPDADQEIRLER